MESRVLIIDDDERLQKLLREYLEGFGFSVISRTVGSEAVKAVEKASPDIIILDIMLPDADGLDIPQHLDIENSEDITLLASTVI